MQEIRDTGVFSESEMQARIPDTPYEGMRRLPDAEYAFILDTAKRVGMGVEHCDELIKRLVHDEPAVTDDDVTGFTGSLLETIGDPVVVVGRAGDIVHVDRRTEELLNSPEIKEIEKRLTEKPWRPGQRVLE